jgi:ATP-dependent DNA ligase
VEDFLQQKEAEANQLDFSNIPTGFCCSKPTSKISDEGLNTLLASGSAIVTGKLNGLCHYIVCNENRRVRLYTRRWEDHTIKYPWIKEYAENQMGLPACTILISEFTIDPALGLPHMESFNLMSSISKVDTLAGVVQDDTTETLRRQEQYPVRAGVFGVLYLDGIPVWQEKYEQVLDMVQKYCMPVAQGFPVFSIPTLASAAAEYASASGLKALLEKNKKLIEGFVVWDKTQAMEVTMNGKPKRRAAWKVKVPLEMDVIAYGYEEGKGRLQGKIGSLKIGQYDSQGNLVSLGTVGSGLDWKNGDCDIENWEFPCVIEIEFDQRFPTGKFQFPRFSKKHEDKRVEEVELFQK